MAPDPKPPPATAKSQPDTVLRRLLGGMSIFTLFMTVPQISDHLGRSSGSRRLRAFVERVSAVCGSLVWVRIAARRQEHLPAVRRLGYCGQRGDCRCARLWTAATAPPPVRGGHSESQVTTCWPKSAARAGSGLPSDEQSAGGWRVPSCDAASLLRQARWHLPRRATSYRCQRRNTRRNHQASNWAMGAGKNFNARNARFPANHSIPCHRC